MSVEPKVMYHLLRSDASICLPGYVLAEGEMGGNFQINKDLERYGSDAIDPRTENQQMHLL